MKLRTLFTCLCVTILLPASTANALSVTVDNSEYRQKMLQYLASDYFITEGVGLQKVYIGQALDDLIAQFGQPNKKKKQGLFTGVIIYSYTLDKETAMQVGIKNRKVQAIAMAGTLASLYTTVKGARFEMTASEVANLYGNIRSTKNSLLYRSQGIRFDFKDNKLRIIRIFPRQQ